MAFRSLQHSLDWTRLVSPAPLNNAANQPLSVNLSWNAVDSSTSYGLQVSLASDFSTTVVNLSGLVSVANMISGLYNSATYYWRVNATYTTGTSAWSGAWSFSEISHFTFTSNTGNNMMVVVQADRSPTIDGSPIAIGDEIGVFDTTGLCVGGTVWNGTNRIITVWGRDSINGSVLNGMRPGETLQYRIWDAPSGHEIRAFATYNTASPATSTSLYVINGVSVLATLGGLDAPGQSAPLNNAANQPLSVNVSWNAVGSATGYGLQVSLASDFSTTVANLSGIVSVTNTVSGLINISTYYWRVNATNAADTSAWSGVWSFSTTTHFAFTSNTGNNMMVVVQTAIGPTIDGSPIAIGDEIGVFDTTGLCVGGTVWNGTNRIITVWGRDSINGSVLNGMHPGETLQYRIWDSSSRHEVRAFATYNTASPATSTSLYVMNGVSILATLSGISAPGTPVLASPTNDAENISISPVLSWNSVPTVLSYHLDVSTTSDFSTTVYSRGSLNETSQQVASLANTTPYYWRVGAKNTGGISGWSSIGSFTTIIAPVLVVPTNAQNLSIVPVLSWSSVPTATSYRLDVSTVSGFSTTVYSAGGLTGTSDSVKGLANSQTYYWRVGAKNGSGISGWSSIGSFTTIIAAPAAPVLSLPTNGAVNQPVALALSWSTVSNAATYAVQVSTDQGFGTTVTAQIGLTGTSASVSGLANSTTYYWRVGAKDAGGVSGWTGGWSFTTIVAVPAAPVLSSPTNGAVNQPVALALSWSTVNNAATYAVQVSTDQGFGATVTAQIGLTGTSASVSGLANSTTYYWRAGAKDAGGVSGWTGGWSFTTIVAVPAAPVLSLPTNGAVNQPVALALSWSTVNNAATYYAVQVSTDQGFGATVTAQIGLTGTSASVSGLANSTTYYWRVGAKDAGGVSGWTGGWSFATIVAVPAAPVLSLPTNGAVNQPVTLALSWTTVSNAATYAVQISTDQGFGSHGDGADRADGYVGIG